MTGGTRRAAIGIACAIGLGVVATAIARSPVPLHDWLTSPVASYRLAQGEVPHPVHLIRPKPAPLSAMARLGRRIFFDKTLSGSGKVSCASCHSPEHAYGPAGAAPVAFGGPDAKTPGRRAVPSLMYLGSEPGFSIGPENDENEHMNLAQRAAAGATARRMRKTAHDTAATAANMVPQGGLFWDGRADTLQQQTYGPLLSPFEMANPAPAALAAKIRQRYGRALAALYTDRNRKSADVKALALARMEEGTVHDIRHLKKRRQVPA